VGRALECFSGRSKMVWIRVRAEGRGVLEERNSEHWGAFDPCALFLSHR